MDGRTDPRARHTHREKGMDRERQRDKEKDSTQRLDTKTPGRRGDQRRQNELKAE